jgi:DNA-binding transcriptional LysR family regulator
MAGLRCGQLSVALTYDLELSDGIAFSPLATLAPYALFAAGHPLAAQPSVTLAELAGEPLVLLDLPLSRDYFRGLFAVVGADPTVAHRSVHPEVIRTMVANGFGYSIVNARPNITVALDGRPLVSRPIAGSPRPMIMGLARLKRLRPTRLVETFEQYCHDAVTDRTMPGLDDGG